MSRRVEARAFQASGPEKEMFRCYCTKCGVVFRSVGGIRASLYNAVTLDDVKQLARFMRDFQLNINN